MGRGGQIRAGALVAVVEVRRRLGNRSLLIQAIVGPVALAAIISLAFGSAGNVDAEVGVVDEDGSPLAAAFARGLVEASADGLEFVAVDGAAEARRRVEDGDLGAAVVVPAGYMASLAGDRPGAVEVIAGDDRLVSSAVARSVADALTARANAARLASAATVAGGGATPSPDDLAGLELPIDIRTRGSGDEVSPAAYFGPSMGLLFLFMTAGIVARSLLDEQRRRILDRVLATPTRPGTVLAGKCASAVVLGVISLSTIWLVTALALGAGWGDPAGVVLLIVATALAVAGIGAAVAAISRTEQAAESFAMAVAFLFALVGGNFIPPGVLPETLRRLSLLSPNGWALHGFAELSAADGTAVDVLPHAAVLLAWALVTGLVAVRLLPRRLEGRA
ncbi:MAG TPA: ABC transporter permease [Acidimicrobiales bacterium]